MTNPLDQSGQTTQQTEQAQSILHHIDRFLEDGMTVYDLNGERVGDVKIYSATAGYLLVGDSGFGQKDLYIPFRLIRGVNPDGISLSAPKDTLAAQYAEPPAIITVVENRAMPGPHGETTPQTREVRMVQSGYDGAMMTVGSIELSSVAERLSVGLAVYDVDGVRLGDITEYDVNRSLLVVEKGIFRPIVLAVPFSAISDVNRDTLSVHLSVPKATLHQIHETPPGDS